MAIEFERKGLSAWATKKNHFFCGVLRQLEFLNVKQIFCKRPTKGQKKLNITIKETDDESCKVGLRIRIRFQNSSVLDPVTACVNIQGLKSLKN